MSEIIMKRLRGHIECFLLNSHFWGAILLFIALLLNIFLFQFSLKNPNLDISSAISVMKDLYYTGGTLLGVSLASNGIKKFINRSKK